MENQEIIFAMIDGDGVVKNTIVVDENWNLGGVSIGEHVVGIGDTYNFVDKKFYKVDGTPCKTHAEIEAELEALMAAKTNQ